MQGQCAHPASRQCDTSAAHVIVAIRRYTTIEQNGAIWHPSHQLLTTNEADRIYNTAEQRAKTFVRYSLTATSESLDDHVSQPPYVL